MIVILVVTLKLLVAFVLTRLGPQAFDIHVKLNMQL